MRRNPLIVLVGAIALAPALFVQGVTAQAVTTLPAADRPVSVEAAEVFRVGGLEAETWETFGETLAMDFGADGSLYILDRGNHRVVALNPDGSFRTEFGREGEGPGEFRTPMSLVVAPSGEIVVLDFAARGFTTFTPDGTYRESIRIPVEGGTFAMGAVQMDPRGGGVYSVAGGGGMMMVSREETGGAAPPPPPPGIPIERLSLAGEPVETLHRAWEPPRTPSGMNVPSGRGRDVEVRIGPSQVAFRPTVRWAVTPDGGVAFVDSTSYRIQLMAPDGRVGRVLERAVPPIPVTERVEEAERARRLEALEEGDGPRMNIVVNDGSGARSLPQSQIREMQMRQLESLAFWPEIAPIRSLAMDRGGRFWVERATEDPTEPGPVDLISFSGAYLGTISADGTRPPVVFGPEGLAAYIERDEYDVATVVVRRLAVPGS